MFSDLEDNNDTRERSFFIVNNKNNKIGRKRKIENENETFGNTCHNKYYSDNIIRKIQSHFISFINCVLKELGYTDEFYNINNKFKINVNKTNIIKINNTNIGYILSQKISSKYKKDQETNKIIY